MNKKNEVPEKRIKELIVLIEKWNYEYYVLNKPSVKDEVYDKHWKELQRLETQYNYILPDSPTQKVGYASNNKFCPVTRKIPMLSLDSVDSSEGLLKFDERVKKILKEQKEIDYVCEWKIDGLSVSLVYQNHQLAQISTRGNGIVGEDITFNKNLLKNVPFSLPGIANCEVRGEVYMEKSEFHRLNKELGKKDNRLLANPRNAAAGSLRTLVPLQDRNLHFFAYQLFFNGKLNTQLSCLKKLEKLGFSVSPDYKLFKNIARVNQFIQKQEKKRKSLNFESDGVVIKVNNYSFYEKLGQTSRFPRWAIAYKFLAAVANSRIKNIYLEVSRSGRITYVAEIEPIMLEGSKISKVTLHNYAFIRSLQLNIGDKVVIKKAGDVIPQIQQIIKLNNKAGSVWSPPTVCPACGGGLKWNSTNIYQLCVNDDCSRKIINYLAHFASKNGVDIKGVSQKIITKLYEKRLLKSPSDFYQLWQKKEELEKLDGLQKKSVDNILSSIEHSKQKPFASLLSALGIPLLSLVKTKKIAKFYPNLTAFLSLTKNNEWEKVKEILGEETQKELKKYLAKPKNVALLEKLNLLWNA